MCNKVHKYKYIHMVYYLLMRDVMSILRSAVELDTLAKLLLGFAETRDSISLKLMQYDTK